MSSRKNNVLVINLLAIIVGMAGLAYASVPLYRLFCQVTGFGGTTQVASTLPDTISDRMVTIRFNTDIDPNLDWNFVPEQKEVTVHIGEQGLAFFKATNDSDIPLTGTAIYNVTPGKVGGYFNKIQCFCFDKQRIEPGETIQFPVSFFVDPDIENDRNLDDVTTITLSYTFFKVKEEQE